MRRGAVGAVHGGVRAEVDAALERLHRGVRLAAFQRALGEHLALALAISGAGMLVARAFGGWSPRSASALMLTAGAALITAGAAAARRAPARESLATGLDLAAGGDGALVTALETGDGAWRARVDRALAALPALERPRWARTLRRASPGIAFCALALFVPLPAPPPAGPPPEMFARREEELREKLAALEETLDWREERADELEELLDQLGREGDEGTPESFFEAADALEARIERAAQDVADESERAGDALAAAAENAAAQAEGTTQVREQFARELAQALAPLALDPKTEADALAGDLPAELAQLAEKLAGEGSAAELARRFADDLAREGLSREELAELARSWNEALGEKLAELARRGLLRESRFDPAARIARESLAEFSERAGKPCSSAACRRAGECVGGAECDGAGECHAAECLAAGECSGSGACTSASSSATPGRGGVQRGRADAELTFGEETPEHAQSFAARALPPGAIPDVDGSVLLGVYGTSPEVDPRLEAAHGEGSGDSAGAAAWKRRLSPAHRETVHNFFNRE